MDRTAILKQVAEIGRQSIGFFDLQESVISKVLSEVIRTGDTVVDGGAHTGRHTRVLAELVGESGRVIAIEPLPHLAKSLEQRYSGAAQVQVLPYALSDREGQVTFSFVQNNPSYSGIHVKGTPGKADIAELQVPCTTLDTILGEPSECRLIKLDLEGAEFHALSGAPGILRRHGPLIVFENDLAQAASHYDYSEDDFFDAFHDWGYEVFDIFGTPLTRQDWREGNAVFDNFIAAKRPDDLAFVQTTLPNILFASLAEMSEVASNLTASVLRIMQWNASGKRVVLFGAGNRARLLLERFPIPVAAVVDNDRGKWGQKLHGIDISDPQMLLTCNAETCVVILSLFGDEIAAQLESMGIAAERVLKMDIR